MQGKVEKSAFAALRLFRGGIMPDLQGEDVAGAPCPSHSSRPLVSFFAAGRNVQEYVEQAMRSMLDQTVDDFELLMLDDGSTDKTYDVMMGVQDPRVQVLRNMEGQGIARSLNRLMSQCRGRYWAHMDADDICAPQRLEKQLQIMQANPDIGICGCHFLAFLPSGEGGLIRLPLDSESIKANLLFKAPMAHPFVTFDGDLFSRLGIQYSEKMVCALDYELYLRIFLRHPQMAFANVDDVLGFYRRHDAQISTARSTEQAQYAFRAQMQVFQTLGVAPGNRLMRHHRHLYGGAPVETAEDMSGLVDWAVTLRMANATRKLFSPDLFNALLYGRLEAAMQRSPHLAQPHLWRLQKWDH